MTSASVAPGGPGQPGPVGGGPIAELQLPYDPQLLDLTLKRRRRRLIMRLISLGVSLAILGAIYAKQHRVFAEQSGPYWVLTAVVLSLVVAWNIVVLVGFLRSRAERRTGPPGIAVRMGRPGVVVASVFSRWEDVAALEVVPGGPGRADRLRLRTHGGSVGLVPLDQVVVHPATLDSTARAYSAGRQGVDLSRLDN